MNSNKMRSIEAKRVDPNTGREFTFRTNLPVEISMQRFEAPVKDIWEFIHYFYWMTWLHDYDFELDDIESEIENIYPLVRHVVDSFWLEEVRVDISEENPEGSIGHYFHLSMSASLLDREGMTQDFADTLVMEVGNSPAVSRAIRWYMQLHIMVSGKLPASAFKKPASMAVRQRKLRERIKKHLDQIRVVPGGIYRSLADYHQRHTL